MPSELCWSPGQAVLQELQEVTARSLALAAGIEDEDGRKTLFAGSWLARRGGGSPQRRRVDPSKAPLRGSSSHLVDPRSLNFSQDGAETTPMNALSLSPPLSPNATFASPPLTPKLPSLGAALA